MLTLPLEFLTGVTEADAKAAMDEFNRLCGDEDVHITSCAVTGENEFSWEFNVDTLHPEDRQFYRGLLEGICRGIALARKEKT